MAKHSHLTLSERIKIEKTLRDRASFSEIGTSLGKIRPRSPRKAETVSSSGMTAAAVIHACTGISVRSVRISGRGTAPNAASHASRSVKTYKKNFARNIKSRPMSATAAKTGTAAHFAIICMTQRPLRKSTNPHAEKAAKGSPSFRKNCARRQHCLAASPSRAVHSPHLRKQCRRDHAG